MRHSLTGRHSVYWFIPQKAFIFCSENLLLQWLLWPKGHSLNCRPPHGSTPLVFIIGSPFKSLLNTHLLKRDVYEALG